MDSVLMLTTVKMLVQELKKLIKIKYYINGVKLIIRQNKATGYRISTMRIEVQKFIGNTGYRKL
jgi:DNA polymerase III sliding clamp (beta) subunit (PCNA family)